MVFAAQADHGDSPVAVPQVVHPPVVAQRQSPMVQTVRRTICIPQMLITVIDDPVMQVVQVFIPVAALRLFPMVQTAVGPWSFPSSWIRWMVSLLCRRTGSHVQVYRFRFSLS